MTRRSLVRAGRKVPALPRLAFQIPKRKASAIADREKKKIGRPKTGIGPNVGLRLYPVQDAAIRDWIARQPDPKPTKPEAIRRLVEKGLEAEAKR